MTILLDSPSITPAIARSAAAVAPPRPVGTAVVGTSPADESACQLTTLPVSTVREGVRVALDRTRRMTVLGSVPVLRVLALPWLLPLHLLIVGLTADHIRHTPDASLSYSDGTAPRAHAGSLALAVLLAAAWLTALCGAAGMLWWLGFGDEARVLLAVALIAPVVELLGLIEFALCNPEWLTLKRARTNRADRRTVFILTSLVSSRDGCGAARRLMDLTYPQWQAVDAVVVGYPASRALVGYYVRMGARRLAAGAAGRRPAGRCITFDCRRPLRAR